MSTGTAGVESGGAGAVGAAGVGRRARAYFASDPVRALQSVLGLVWLLDGALQFQSFMYSHGFIEMLLEMLPGQPRWLVSSLEWGVHIAEHDLGLFNTLFALVQISIGLGLLWRRSVKPALAVSFVWVAFVWWFGEAFGMIFMPTMATPLTGAPGAVLLYAIIGLIVWPNGRPGGLLGSYGARTAWLGLWLVCAWMWLGAGPSNNVDATRYAIEEAPSGMGWLTSVQEWAIELVQGNSYGIAIVLGLLSAAIGIAVAARWQVRLFLALAIVINLVFWVVGQGFGGIFEGGEATDPNSGIMFVLLALAMLTVLRQEAGAGERPLERPDLAGRAPSGLSASPPTST